MVRNITSHTRHGSDHNNPIRHSTGSLISAIIVNFHSARLAARAVSSLLLQAPVMQILVVNNSPCVEEREILRSLSGPSCRIIEPGENLGFGRACNLACSQAGGEFILLMNPDAFAAPGMTAKLAGFLKQEKRAAAVGPCTFLDEEMKVYMPAIPSPSPWDCLAGHKFVSCFREPRIKYWRRISRKLWFGKRPVRVPHISGGIMLIRRAALGGEGIFDERFRLYFEDSDLCVRLRRKGGKLYLLPEAHAVHVYDSCGTGHEEFKREQFGISLEKFMRKHHFHAWPVSRFLCRHLSLETDHASCRTFEKGEGPFETAVPAGKDLFLYSINREFFPEACIRCGPGRFRFPEKAWKTLRADQVYYWRFERASGP